MAIGINYRGENDGPYETGNQVDELLDQLRAQTAQSGKGIIAMVYRFGDVDWTGPVMEIGVNGEKGYVLYNDGQGNGAISLGGATEGDVDYYFQGNHRDQEAKYETSYEAVKQAVGEFLRTDGGKPMSPTWDELED